MGSLPSAAELSTDEKEFIIHISGAEGTVLDAMLISLICLYIDSSTSINLPRIHSNSPILPLTPHFPLRDLFRLRPARTDPITQTEYNHHSMPVSPN